MRAYIFSLLPCSLDSQHLYLLAISLGMRRPRIQVSATTSLAQTDHDTDCDKGRMSIPAKFPSLLYGNWACTASMPLDVYSCFILILPLQYVMPSGHGILLCTFWWEVLVLLLSSVPSMAEHNTNATSYSQDRRYQEGVPDGHMNNKMPISGDLHVAQLVGILSRSETL